MFCDSAGACEWMRESPCKRRNAHAARASLQSPVPQGKTHYAVVRAIEQGPVALCIHGLSTSSPMSGVALAKGLALTWAIACWSMTIMGAGMSDTSARDCRTAPFSYKQLTDLAGSHEKVDTPMTVLGYSMGGAIATAFRGGLSGQDPAHLILLAPGRDAGHRRGLIRALIARDWPCAIGDWLLSAGLPGNGLAQGTSGRSGPARQRSRDQRAATWLKPKAIAAISRQSVESLRGVLACDGPLNTHKKLYRNRSAGSGNLGSRCG